jgi:hypothetical protein
MEQHYMQILYILHITDKRKDINKIPIFSEEKN